MGEFEMYFNRSNPDLTYIYELFLRRVYHCDQYGDPFEISGADSFSTNDNDQIDSSGFVGIWTAFNLLIPQIKYDADIKKVKKMMDLFEENPTKTYFKRICKELFKILDENKIEEFPHWNAFPYKV
jgi:hypothetical protein